MPSRTLFYLNFPHLSFLFDSPHLRYLVNASSIYVSLRLHLCFLIRCHRKFFYLSYLSLVLFRDARLKFIRVKTELYHSHCHSFSIFCHHSLRFQTMSRFELITTRAYQYCVISLHLTLDSSIYLAPAFSIRPQMLFFLHLQPPLPPWPFPIPPLHRNHSSSFFILHLFSVTYTISNPASSNLPQMSNCSSW
jgi:hypothetical protein